MTDALTLDDFIADLTALDQTLPVLTDSGHGLVEPQPVMPALDFEMGDTSNVIAAGLPLGTNTVQTVADVLDMYGFALEIFSQVGARGDSALMVADHGVGVRKMVAVEEQSGRVIIRTAA